MTIKGYSEIHLGLGDLIQFSALQKFLASLQVI